VEKIVGTDIQPVVFIVTQNKREKLMKINTLQDLYIEELQDLYSAEHQLLKALPKMAEAASSEGLRDAFLTHLHETENQVARLKTVFEGLGMQPKAARCKAMEGLIAEGSEWMKEPAKSGVMDAGLIAAAQRVEHYEMAGYGCVRTYAQLLGETEAMNLLQKTLDEEGAADKKLTQLSKRINIQAESSEEAARSQKKSPRKRSPATSNGRRKTARAKAR
jgi:ferritin-like metal-binding protein YciE